ncbi:hypothetical protein Tco_1459922 [Tanacetum coccineum]
MVAAFQAPPSPDYVSGPEEPKQAPSLPEFVYPEFMPPEDDVLPTEEQPLPAAVSPTADLPSYDPADYPTDRDDDDEEEEPSRDKADNEEEDEDDEEEKEEEHLAPANFIPPHVHRVTTRISIRAQTPVSLPSDTEVVRLLAIPTPPSSPLSPWSSPLPQIPSPPLLVSPPLSVSLPPPASPTYPLGYRDAMIQLRAEALSNSYSLPLPPPIILSRTRSDSPPSGTPPILPIPLPTSSLSLLLPSADHGADRPEVCLPPWKRLCISLGIRYEIGRLGEIQRGDTWDEMLEDMPGAPATDETELGWRMTNFVTTVRQDTDEIYVRLGKTQDERSLMSGRLNLLQRDRRAYSHIALLMKREARLSREAWGWSMDASDLACSEVMELQPPATTTTPTTSVTDKQLKRLIDQGIIDALAARDADRSRNGEDSHDSGTGVRRKAPLAR